ncbi:helix-turn-helix transcriptional regulator [bacterium]|nr:helix-turn-helix transcriptional regulator [bacterium]
MADQSRIVRLNNRRLRERISELGLKQWAVARQTGVARRTVIRWINGEVSRITTDNLQSLARVVSLSPAELSSELSLDQAASTEEQQLAANSLLSQKMGEMFLRSESYEAYEQMLSALRHPGMSMEKLASIYLHMMAAAAMQHEFGRAREHGRQTIACAERCNNRDMEFTARINLSIINSETGQVAQMHDELETLLAMMESQDVRKPYGAVCINIARACRLMSEPARATHFAIEAVKAYYGRRDVMSFTEALVLAAIVCMDLSAPQVALGYLSDARSVAEQHDLAVWLPAITLREMEAGSQLGQKFSLEQVLATLDQYDKVVYVPIDCYHAAVRTLYASGEASQAVLVLNRGLERPWIRPQEAAMLHLELAIIRHRAGNVELFAQPARKAAALFEECGMHARADSALRFAETGEEPRSRTNDGLVAMLREAIPEV